MIPREVLSNIRRIEIRTKRLVNEVFSGEYASVFKGRGMEFSEVREYLPGDDIRAIDWNVTARMGHPYVKKFEEERELTIVFLVDASASGRFGTVSRFKSELAAELCALLAFSATRHNDRVGLIVFTDRIEKVVPPTKGRVNVLRVVRELLYFQPTGKGTDIPRAVDYLSSVVRRHAIVFLVSDFQTAGYERALAVANRRYDLIAVRVSDPREERLPRAGLVELEDPETGDRLTVDAGDRSFVERFAGEVGHESHERDRLFRKLGIDSISVSTDRPYVEPLEKFFRTRARRAGPLAAAAVAFLVLAGAWRPGPASAEAGVRAPVVITASVEPDTATVGDRLTLRLRVEADQGVTVTFPDVATLAAPLEVVGSATVPAEAPEGRAVEERAYLLAAFETGTAKVPAMPFAFVDAGGDSGVVVSDSLAVVIRSVLPTAEGEAEPRDIKPPVELPRRVWPYLVAAAAAAAAAVLYRRLARWWRARRREREEAPEEPAVPRHAAHVVAFERLKAVERDDPIGRGELLAFYVRVTEALRLYLRDRFGVDAIDMTTSELGPAMREAAMDEREVVWMTGYLAHADLAKFAKYAPSVERARDDFRTAWEFVERTRFRGEEAAGDVSAPAGEATP